MTKRDRAWSAAIVLKAPHVQRATRVFAFICCAQIKLRSAAKETMIIPEKDEDWDFDHISHDRPAHFVWAGRIS